MGELCVVNIVDGVLGLDGIENPIAQTAITPPIIQYKTFFLLTPLHIVIPKKVKKLEWQFPTYTCPPNTPEIHRLTNILTNYTRKCCY